MPNLSVIFTVGFRNLDDAIDLYKMARHQAGTPPITNIPGILGVANTQVWQENGHQRELNIVAHVVNSGLYTNKEIAEVIILGGHQRHMPKNVRRDMIDVVAYLMPWVIAPSITCFQDLINDLDTRIRSQFLARRTPRSRRWKLGRFGLLLKYDMALRIAYAYYQDTGLTTFMPTNVYLNQGARTGAKNLLGCNPPQKMAAAAINPAFSGSGLSDDEIEDFLCVMHPFLSVGGVLPGQVAKVVCGKHQWLINRSLIAKIKRNHPIACMDLLFITKK